LIRRKRRRRKTRKQKLRRAKRMLKRLAKEAVEMLRRPNSDDLLMYFQRRLFSQNVTSGRTPGKSAVMQELERQLKYQRGKNVHVVPPGVRLVNIDFSALEMRLAKKGT